MSVILPRAGREKRCTSRYDAEDDDVDGLSCHGQGQEGGELHCWWNTEDVTWEEVSILVLIQASWFVTSATQVVSCGARVGFDRQAAGIFQA